MEFLNDNRLLKTFWHMRIYLILFLLIALCIGYIYSFYYKTPMYRSTAVVLLVQDLSTTTSTTDSITGSDITLNKNLLSTYTKLAKTDKVLEKVISNLKLNISTSALSNLISIQSTNNTQVININVINENNKLAASIANNLVDVFSEEIKEIYNMDNIHTMDYAEVSTSPYNINHSKDLLLSVILGILAYCLLSICIYIFDNTIKTEKDLENYNKLTVLSTIPIYNKSQNNKDLIVDINSKSPVAEAFKTCRTNISFSNSNRKSSSILVISASQSDGKSFISSNLALTFALSNKKVLLIDTDMRNGRLHKIFNLEPTKGLSNCLSRLTYNTRTTNINDYIKETKYKNLHLMTFGNIAPNPSELLSSKITYDLIETLKTKYDVVICDGTPTTLVSDSIILSKIVDYTVLVTSYRTTKIDTVNKVKKSAELAGGHIDGAILNKYDLTKKSYKNKYYDKTKTNENSETIQLEHDTTLDTPLLLKKFDYNKTEKIKNTQESKTLDDNTNTNLSEIVELLNDTMNSVSKKEHDYSDNWNTRFDDIDERFNELYYPINELQKQMDNICSSNNNLDEKLSNIIEPIYENTETIKNKLISNTNTDMSELINLLNSTMNSVSENQSNFSSAINNKFDELYTPINELQKQIEILHSSSNNIDEKINDILEPIYKNTERIKNTLINNINTQKVQNQEIQELKDTIHTVKDLYENKFRAQEDYLYKLENKIEELSTTQDNNTKSNNEYTRESELIPNRTNIKRQIIDDYYDEPNNLKVNSGKVISFSDIIKNEHDYDTNSNNNKDSDLEENLPMVMKNKKLKPDKVQKASKPKKERTNLFKYHSQPEVIEDNEEENPKSQILSIG